jgi:hypothetical protein
VGLRKGDIVVSENSGIQGIVLDFRYSEYNSYYHKTVIYCTFAPEYEMGKVNTVFEINSNYLKRRK